MKTTVQYNMCSMYNTDIRTHLFVYGMVAVVCGMSLIRVAYNTHHTYVSTTSDSVFTT